MIQSRRYRVVLTPLPVDIEPMPPKIDLYLYFTNSLKKHSSVTTLILFEYKLFLHCAEALKHDKINSICLQMPDAHTHYKNVGLCEITPLCPGLLQFTVWYVIYDSLHTFNYKIQLHCDLTLEGVKVTCCSS